MYRRDEAGPPADYEGECTTVWSFRDRGTWAGHRGSYPGNWSPYIPRNLIVEFSRPGDLVLDPMMGSGTTLVEAGLLGRRAIGIDINPRAVHLARAHIQSAPLPDSSLVNVHLGDARRMDHIQDNSVDLVAIHPPYASIIRYSNGSIPQDLSSAGFNQFEAGLREVAMECYRVTAPGKYCAVMMGDTRTRRHYVPLADVTFGIFWGAGFLLRDQVVKLQWNVSSERRRWTERKYSFYKIAHERIFVFRKPTGDQDIQEHRWSARRGWAKPDEVQTDSRAHTGMRRH